MAMLILSMDSWRKFSKGATTLGSVNFVDSGGSIYCKSTQQNNKHTDNTSRNAASLAWNSLST